MKICIMLKHYGQHGGGVKVYTQNLIRELLNINTDNEYLLLYKDPNLLGTFENYLNVKEICIESNLPLIWDQYYVPKIAEKEKCDIIFNPKYSIPLNTKISTAFVCHGLDWYVMPWGSKPIDRLNHKFLIPQYSKKASSIIAVSNTTKEHLIKYLHVEESRINTVYHGVNESYRKVKTKEELEATRKKYRLPDKFYLYAGQIYPPKNFGRLIQAYAKAAPFLNIPLVVAGEHRWLCEDEIALIDKLGISNRVIRLGWIEQDELSHLFKMATALLMPSLYESFGCPIIEAMASGTPVLTSNRYGTKEVANDAAYLIDPEDIESITAGIIAITLNIELREKLIARGYIRSQNFSWTKCARETLNVLENTININKAAARIEKNKAKIYNYS